MILVKSTTTSDNGHRELKTHEWGLFDSDCEEKAWREEKREAVRKWNYETPGAVSFRHVDFDSYDISAVKYMSMSYLDGMPVGMFKKILSMVDEIQVPDKKG